MAKAALSHQRFRRLCRAFGLMGWAAVVVTTLLILFQLVLLPVLAKVPASAHVFWVRNLPAIFYLYAVGVMSGAMIALSRGRLVQAVLVRALRRVGVALAAGAVVAIVGVTNLLNWLGLPGGGYAHFDVAALALLLVGGSLILIAKVLDEAVALQAELDQFV